MFKNFPFTGPFHKQHGKASKNCWNLNHTTSPMFIDQSAGY